MNCANCKNLETIWNDIGGGWKVCKKGEGHISSPNNSICIKHELKESKAK